MPIGIQRLNARHQQPNSLIIFIKPLPGPTTKFAQDFLERVAAIVHPIMKANHLSITSLEEYEPNREFVGRNFNAGEVIQLVLRAPHSGHWLSFRSVQMVMIHELAHCAQMNHSAAFWKVRNAFVDELRVLWGKGYTGDGFWGRGETLLSAQYDWQGGISEEQVLPQSLCGGTFRSGRRGKRKRKGEKSSLTYSERQQRRIARKFGTSGVKLGDDEATRVKLEDGKKPKGKPRVAGSARGRELRAAAALARFGDQKQEKLEGMKKEEYGDSGSEAESDYEDAEIWKEAVDLNGARILDSRGNGMVKVCENEDQDDVHVKQEMEELQHIDSIELLDSNHLIDKGPPYNHKEENESIHLKRLSIPNPTPLSTVLLKKQRIRHQRPPEFSESTSDPNPLNTSEKPAICPICSLGNDPMAVTCVACLHVIRTKKSRGHWRCGSTTCEGSHYINGGDCGVCGVCGTKRNKGVELEAQNFLGSDG